MEIDCFAIVARRVAKKGRVETIANGHQEGVVGVVNR
jgi:hypothetical protein